MSGEVPALPQAVLAGIYRHARAEFPNECCGFVLGQGESAELVVCENVQDRSHAVDPETWKRRNFNYIWPTRLLRARADVIALVPEGSRFILIDGNEWGDGQPIPGRQALPFLERDGIYWGPPADDATAITELQRVRRAGTSFLALWWTSFWWLDEYPRFFEYLSGTFECALKGEHLMLFDLRN